MDNNISLLIGLKNNLEFSKSCYQSIRENYPETEIVFVSYGSSDGTHEWLTSLKDENLVCFSSAEGKTLSDTYNKAIEISTKDYVCFLHNDMVIGRNFLSELEISLKERNLVYYKVVEPPIFASDKRLWKEIQDFGSDFETFQFDKFFQFEKVQEKQKGEYTNDVSFFLAAKKDVLQKVNGLDPLFNPMFCEDDDLILRLRMSGEKTFVCPNAIVYHFVSKTSRFSDEFQNRTKKIEENSLRNFVRKWGFFNQSKTKKKLNIGLILENPNEDAIKNLEIFVDHIYSDFNPEQYINEEQKNTLFDLKEKFRSKNSGFSDDIMIKFDAKKLSEKNMYTFRNLSDIIDDLKNSKKNFLQKLFTKDNTFKVNNLTIEILNENSYEKQLITRNNA
ncbi:MULTISPECIES: glycosyltransferase [Chryseobacterium]|uniref:GT2 family glycosyltransferase n=1 Tax=Chryseobacterium geocarposphaerae TaxID=1416776 RepID=A0ABU1LGB2_9FLAO|nr:MULTISPECIES: glycosyltransferase [Chryseobacterium]MDR6405761.1 GT2 family glycosyltransferase [Chryseobacterium geocarposphaerae]MDR6699076.1 GT2 family glycosyltransferase [Chryseobacterium ginsenosidimutans]